ncbi:putative F-actin-capping protein subunit beta [Panicum miliaceum]|uniref:F-actin-capping protein subunit beta n=1 Tax=Panicum miliaceum TaxID=4540 RepID=A0A3L6TEY8_PANMI|nr:putative F-actin-capping protein subunit beta [Panicum miliaceum]
MDLMRRMPPASAETALNALLSLLPDHSLDLLSQVDLPLQVCMDKESLKEYILCEYNRDADSYRSPWSNKYDPPLEDGTLPSEEMRNLEIEANEVFSVYRDQYYEGGISSVYIWEDEDNGGFIACFLIKKDGKGTRGYMQIGSWDAIHVIQGNTAHELPVERLVGPEEEGAAHYCLNSTVMLSLTTDNKQSGTFNLSGSIRRQVAISEATLSLIGSVTEMSMTLAVADGHLVNMGKMIEEMEGKLRNSLDQLRRRKCPGGKLCRPRPKIAAGRQVTIAAGLDYGFGDVLNEGSATAGKQGIQADRPASAYLETVAIKDASVGLLLVKDQA